MPREIPNHKPKWNECRDEEGERWGTRKGKKRIDTFGASLEHRTISASALPCPRTT
jgi:hypothetical protein